MMKRLIYSVLTTVLVFSSLLQAQNAEMQNLPLPMEVKLPGMWQKTISKVQYDLLGNEKGISQIEVVNENCLHIQFCFSLNQTVRQDDWQVVVTPDFSPSFHWSPHLTPTPRHIIDQHVFRSPALIAADDRQVITLIPDLDIMKKGTPVRWYLDLDAENNRLVLGMSNSRVDDHVLFVRESGAEYPAGEVEIGFFLMVHTDEASLKNPFRKPLDFLWDRWGHDLYQAGNPVDADLERYVDHTYNWAFNSWADAVWQDFELNGNKVGAPVFIVNVTQSPNYPGEVNEREFRSVWN